MATIVNLPPDRRFENIGRSVGEGFSQGVEHARTKQENEQKKREFDALLNQLKVNKVTEPEDILQVAATSSAFDSPEQAFKFADFYSQTVSQAGEDVSMQEVTVDGKNQLLPMTNTDLLDARSRGLAAHLGLPTGTEAEFGSVDESEMIPILDLSTGREVRRVKKDGFDAKNLAPNESTVDDFDRKLKLQAESRASAGEKRAAAEEKRKQEKHDKEQTGEGDIEIKSDLQRRAEGQLRRRNEEVTKESLSKETSIVAAVDKFSGRIARSTGVKVNSDGTLASFKEQGDDLRFDAAITAFPDLIREGLSDTKAFSASKKIANALEVGENNSARQALKFSKPEEIGSDEFVSKLKERDKGRVFKVKDDDGSTTFFVYTGNPNNPYMEFKP